jgi:hypothetical protein
MSHSHTSVVFDVQTKTHDELEELYDIEIHEDGSVYDHCESQEYPSLMKWAIEMDHLNSGPEQAFEKRGGRYAFDDEY